MNHQTIRSNRADPRRMPRGSHLFVLGISTAFASAVIAQDPPVRSIGSQVAKFVQPFSEMTDLRELSDGRVIVLDARELTIQLVDLNRGVTRNIGRRGNGPGEYRLPRRLLALSGDNSAVEDLGSGRRLLTISWKGEIGGSIVVPNLNNADNPLGTDTQGRIYSLPRVVAMDRGPMDSARIVRWTPATGRRDTVAKISTRVVSPLRRSSPWGPVPPFATWDQWAVSRDGRVAVASAEPYRITFFNTDGTRILGPALRVERVEVSERHKQQWRGEWRRQRWSVIIYKGGRRESALRRPPFKEPVEWPKYLPPFLPGAARFDPNGLLWIQRTGEAGAPPAFDVIDRTGRIAMRVVLPRRARLIGFGRSSVYLARFGKDDLEYLERYQLPSI